ncbi:hypothetical protein VTN77DRAFT_4502 [Rasamsonia byssochlamydoides]|uniref:uncharacterized protein n=1 Tax=Rasamsonia byssochlamydoides TaxID=89139 RepID=UPI0037444384
MPSLSGTGNNNISHSPLQSPDVPQQDKVKKSFHKHGTGGSRPLPYRRTTITRSDLAPLSASKAVRETALWVFWSKNTFLYCPKSRANKKNAIRFLALQPIKTRQYLRRIESHIFFESAYMRVWDEELTARLQPLESILRRLPKTQRLNVRLELWKSGEPPLLQTCRFWQLKSLGAFRTRVKWRLKRVYRATRARLAVFNESIQFCKGHLKQRDDDSCSWT